MDTFKTSSVIDEILIFLKSTLQILPVIWAFYAPARIIILFLLSIIIWDTVLGIKASKKNNRPLKSSRYNDFFAKVISYALFIGIGLMVGDMFNIENAFFFASLPAFYSELKSIDENQRELNRKGIFTYFEETWNVVLKVKKERDKLNRNE